MNRKYYFDADYSSARPSSAGGAYIEFNDAQWERLLDFFEEHGIDAGLEDSPFYEMVNEAITATLEPDSCGEYPECDLYFPPGVREDAEKELEKRNNTTSK